MDAPLLSDFAINTLLTVAVVGTGAWLLSSKKKIPDGLVEPPSAPGHWLLGQTLVLTTKDYHKQFVKWANDLGSVYRIWIGVPAYIIADASLAGPLMIRGPDYQPKSGVVYGQTTWASYNTHSIFNEHDESDPMWKRMRKASSVCFAVEHIKKIFPLVLGTTDQMMSIWSKIITPGPDGTPEAVVDIGTWIQRCILASMLNASFNVDSKALEGDEHNFDNEMLHVLHDLLHELSLRIANPLRAPLHTVMPLLSSARHTKKQTLRFREMMEVVWEKIKANGPYPADNQTLGAVIYRMAEAGSDGPAMPHAQLIGNLGTFLVASFDTSASAVSWALYNIASRPDVQQRCIKDLYDVGLLHVAGQPTPRSVAWEDLTSMPYLQATLKESLRFSTTPATGTIREATTDMTVGKYFIPKGSVVWIPFVCIHESKHNFTDARVFNPSRWLSTDGDKAGALNQEGDNPTTTPAADKVESGPTPTGNAANLSKSYLPFSTGPRDCVGQSLANITLRTIVISILSRFHLSVHPDTGTPEEVDANQVIALVVVFGKPLKLILRPHAAAPV